MAASFVPGQRWLSESEPELGLGTVLHVNARTVVVRFPAAEETREYARDNAPLRRLHCGIGDTVEGRNGVRLLVSSVTESRGLLTYHGAEGSLRETDLADVVISNRPEQRLLAGTVDSPDLFQLRFEALQQQHRRRRSSVRGFVGGRIDLIPHQLYIAGEVSGRLLPRVLLADEVGLGKTIEACLIVHRLLLTGRARRVLVLVPESLVHQWFVELLRRFNLWFHIFDEARCVALETNHPGTNPFLDDQWILAPLPLLTTRPERSAQILAAGWDLVVVDEAHHLGWSPENASPAYQQVEQLGRQSPGLLLLTATPEQLGVASHFARLRLLDPDRFHDLAEFTREAESYREVAHWADFLQQTRPGTDSELARLAQILNEPPDVLRGKLNGPSPAAARRECLDALLDRHGTSRVMFRNTRATISGFPRRRAHLQALPSAPGEDDLLERLAEEFAADTAPGIGTDFRPKLSGDPRILWLADLLRSLGEEKVLLLCRTQAKVEAIESALRERVNLKLAAFHEGLTLVQRDRQAAWFAEEDGARLLLCSEIGGEGRNFQFAHHLVLFDLPADPELLEQRIGRLDRIGQRAEIQIHVPFVVGSSQEVLARWYQDGLSALEMNLPGARELRERLGARVHDLAHDFHETETTSRPELTRLIQETRDARTELAHRLEHGRDRLLELNSFRREPALRLAQEIRAQDDDRSLEQFLIAAFDHYTLHVEELSQRTYRLGSAGVFADSFPGLPAEGLTITCDRAQALAREDIQFVTSDHPLVSGALDLILGSELGNSSYGVWPDPRTRGMYLEVVYLLECVAPAELHVDRFLPPTPIRIVLDHQGQEVGTTVDSKTLARQLRSGDPFVLLDQSEIREELLPELLEQVHGLARSRIAELVARAQREMQTQLDREIHRLRELQKVNRTVRTEEIEALIRQRDALVEHLKGARLRCDSLRLIRRGPA